jgi:acyl carrier protein phosphodiesterase
MNYLAHVFLARATPALLTGGLLGDFVKGRIDDAWPAAMRTGIELHRAIDHYTDAHPLVTASRALIAPERRRFAGILVDVFYDHFLARHWPRHAELPLDRFTQHVYAVLWPQRREFPERLQRILPWMRADDWLASYADLDAVAAALRGMARRCRYAERARPLAGGIDDLHAHYAPLERQFLDFFPQLECFAAERQHGRASPAASTARAG